MAEQHHVAPMKDHNDDDAAADDHHPDQQQEKKGEVHHNDNEHHSGGGDERRLYNHPMQRQKWGDPQVLPHTDWGATFFDLFYVAAYVTPITNMCKDKNIGMLESAKIVVCC